MLPSLLKSRTLKQGFTLAELLIALAILGVIATFTIPKILVAQQNASYNAKVKEAASAMAAALQYMKTQGLATSNTKATDLFQYMNYVSSSYSAATLLDSSQTGTTGDCLGGCIFLANGAGIRGGAKQFMATNTTNAIGFTVDPDGVVTDGTTNGPGKSVSFYLNYQGRLTTVGTVEPGQFYYNNVEVVANPSADPPYFSW